MRMIPNRPRDAGSQAEKRMFEPRVSGFKIPLNQAMDSRFLPAFARMTGNDVISARRVIFTLAVIPAKAGIHFGQRIPKLEFEPLAGARPGHRTEAKTRAALGD